MNRDRYHEIEWNAQKRKDMDNWMVPARNASRFVRVGLFRRFINWLIGA